MSAADTAQQQDGGPSDSLPADGTPARSEEYTKLIELEKEVFRKLRDVETRLSLDEAKYIGVTKDADGSVGNLISGWEALEGKQLDKKKAQQRMFSGLYTMHLPVACTSVAARRASRTTHPFIHTRAESSETWKEHLKQQAKKEEEKLRMAGAGAPNAPPGSGAPAGNYPPKTNVAPGRGSGGAGQGQGQAQSVPAKRPAAPQGPAGQGQAAAPKPGVPSSGFSAPALGVKRPREPDGTTPINTGGAGMGGGGGADADMEAGTGAGIPPSVSATPMGGDGILAPTPIGGGGGGDVGSTPLPPGMAGVGAGGGGALDAAGRASSRTRTRGVAGGR